MIDRFKILRSAGIALAILLAGINYQASAQEGVTSDNRVVWTGGMNSCQFCEIDLDLDGVHDMLVFDRHGNRILPFLYTGLSGPDDYLPDTSYVSSFPDLHDWIITADYDCDGRRDLFTYGLGGIRVFRNASDTILKFELITNMLTSWYYSGKVGILVTPVDYPAVSDIDGDGDLDMLTFFGLGSFVEYHQNLSMEKYGNCDSLDYRLDNNCWGKFKESEGSNKITLNADCPGMRDEGRGTREERHTGSTLLAIDLTNNGLKDLILADIDYPNLIALYNYGTIDTAFITSIDTLFPPGTKPVNLFDFPVASWIDIGHDGLKDIVISSFNPSLTIAENDHCTWFYENRGSIDLPVFEFNTNQFLQDRMIDVGSGSYPLLSDINGDGLTDLLVGSWGKWDSSYYEQTVLKSVFTGRITYFQNTGSQFSPFYSMVTDDLASISALKLTGIFPALGDLTGDGYPDMITGQEDGTILYFENDGLGSDPPGFLPPLLNFQSIDVGKNSAPQLFDFDSDGLADLILGERNGNLNYFHNSGNATNPVFTFITDSLGKINVTNYQQSYTGYSTPCFFIDQSGKQHLIVGSEEGKIWYFRDIPSDPEQPFVPSDLLYELITGSQFPLRCGWRTSPAIEHLTNPQKMDLVTGNFSGGLNYFSYNEPPQVLLSINKLPESVNHTFSVYPNPAKNNLTIHLRNKSSGTGYHAEILDLLGKRVFSCNECIPGSISLPDLPEGLYLITLKDPDGINTFSTRKLIIVR